jgi:hypothetical protein
VPFLFIAQLNTFFDHHIPIASMLCCGDLAGFIKGEGAG